MNVAPPLPDLHERTRQVIQDALSGGRTLSLTEMPRAWPVTRVVMRAVAQQMVEEGTLVRVPWPDRGGPARFALTSV